MVPVGYLNPARPEVSRARSAAGTRPPLTPPHRCVASMCPPRTQPLRPSVQIDPNSALGRALLASPLDGALGRQTAPIPPPAAADPRPCSPSTGSCRPTSSSTSGRRPTCRSARAAAWARAGASRSTRAPRTSRGSRRRRPSVDCPLDADLTTMAGEFELHRESTRMLSLGPSVDDGGHRRRLAARRCAERPLRPAARLPRLFRAAVLSYACSSAAPSMGVYFALKLLVGVFGGAANVAGFTLACELVGASLRTPLTVELWALLAVMEVFCAVMASAMRDAPWRSFIFVMSLPAHALARQRPPPPRERCGSSGRAPPTPCSSRCAPRSSTRSLAERLGVPEELWLEGSSSSSKVGDGTKVVSSLPPPPPRPPPSRRRRRPTTKPSPTVRRRRPPRRRSPGPRCRRPRRRPPRWTRRSRAAAARSGTRRRCASCLRRRAARASCCADVHVGGGGAGVLLA